ncbi:MAG: hypothetical protein QOH00_3181, partial [Gaiellales bacterium]|nr:hypothetical protein [Gaiellales bacterium]
MPIESRTPHGNQQIDAAELSQLDDISSAIKSVYT